MEAVWLAAECAVLESCQQAPLLSAFDRSAIATIASDWALTKWFDLHTVLQLKFAVLLWTSPLLALNYRTISTDSLGTTATWPRRKRNSWSLWMTGQGCWRRDRRFGSGYPAFFFVLQGACFVCLIFSSIGVMSARPMIYGMESWWSDRESAWFVFMSLRIMAYQGPCDDLTAIAAFHAFNTGISMH